MRLEVRPPVGGPRLVVTADGRRLLALDLANRRAEIWNSQSEGVAKLIGASLDAADLRTLLEGRSPCSGGAGVAADGSCPFAGGRYRPGTATGASDMAGGALLGLSGSPVLYLEYPPPPPAAGDWRRSVVLRRPGDGPALQLTLDSGPTRSGLDPAIFSTDRPQGFEPGMVLEGEGLAGILGAGEGAGS